MTRHEPITLGSAEMLASYDYTPAERSIDHYAPADIDRIEISWRGEDVTDFIEELGLMEKVMEQLDRN